MNYEVISEGYRVVGMDWFIMFVLIISALLCLGIAGHVIVDGNGLKAMSMLVLAIALLTLAAYINDNFKAHIIVVDKKYSHIAESEGYSYLYSEGTVSAMFRKGDYRQEQRTRRRRDESEVEDNSEVHSDETLYR